MSPLTSRLLFIAVCLIASNYLYQYANAGDWRVATERSWFEAVALFVVWIQLWIWPIEGTTR